MSRYPFRIIPQGDVGKTALLYKGEEEDLEEVSHAFSNVKSSEVHPAFKEDFHCAVHFYDASDRFQKQLRNYCSEHLTGLDKGSRDSETSSFSINVKWILLVLAALIVGYLLITFLSELIQLAGKVG